MSSGRIGTWLAKLSHQDLVLLRLFLLDHLGMRASATPTHIRAAVMDWQRGAEDEMWGLELVTEGGGAAGGAGKQGGKGGKGECEAGATDTDCTGWPSQLPAALHSGCSGHRLTCCTHAAMRRW